RRTPIERCSPIAYTLALFSASLWSYYVYINLKWTVLRINALRSYDARIFAARFTGFFIDILCAPLSSLPRVFRERDVGDMSCFLALSLTMSGAFWFGYALLTHDLCVAISNGIGAVQDTSQM
ncbi:bidirectional sugar transporter SWEET15, partial [Striga asiatica]